MARKTTRRLSLAQAILEAERTGAFAAAAAAETAPPVEEKPKTEKAPKAPKHPALDGERLAFVLANARPAVTACLCGCGETTKGRFFPGHDATLKSALALGAKAGCEDSKAALVAFGW